MRPRLPMLIAAIGILFFSYPFSANARTAKPPSNSLRSQDALERQNFIADKCGLERIPDDTALQKLTGSGVLIPMPQEIRGLRITAEKKFQYLLPHTAEFLVKLAEKYHHAFNDKLKITSLVRTEIYQNYLVRLGISDANGRSPKRRSTHMTGAAFDISKRQLTGGELHWLRKELSDFKKAGAIDFIEERKNNTFHVMVIPPDCG